MHYELRSQKVTPRSRRSAGMRFTSWSIVRSQTYKALTCSKTPRLPPGFSLSPREQWLQGNHEVTDGSGQVLQHAALNVLISGTLRGFRKCAPTVHDTLIRANSPVQVFISTYDHNDCGGSIDTHGLGLHPRPLHRSFWQAYETNEVRPVAHVEPISRIEQLKQMHPASIHPVFVRYHSQFFLRHLAMHEATAARDANNSIFILLRPDAHLFGRWVFYHVSRPNQALASLTLRDGSTCNVTLTPDTLYVPWSDIHDNLPDDALAIGYGRAMHAYVSFYKMMPEISWVISEKVEHKLERYMRQKFGVQMAYPCGAHRGDMLKLVKTCDTIDE